MTNLTAFTTCNVNKAADLAHAGTVKKVSQRVGEREEGTDVGGLGGWGGLGENVFKQGKARWVAIGDFVLRSGRISWSA